jgi:hypothetical protein
MLIVTGDGTVTGFGLANPTLAGERDEVRQMLQCQPANCPRPGPAIVADKGFAGDDLEKFLAGPELDLTPVRPARKREGPGDRPELAAPARGGDHLDPQAPARPGTPRRAGTRRAAGPRRPAPARAERRHLAQLEHRRTGQPLAHRI